MPVIFANNPQTPNNTLFFKSTTSLKLFQNVIYKKDYITNLKRSQQKRQVNLPNFSLFI
jgi:hypothetical protein